MEGFTDMGDHRLLVGAGQVDITPPLGTLDGRIGDGQRTAEIDAPVTVRVLYLEQPGGEDPVVLGMGDFGGMTHETDRRVRRLIGEALGVDPSRVRVNASHNHSCIGGYLTVQRYFESVGRNFLDKDWFENTVMKGFVSAAQSARATRRPARMEIGTAPVDGVVSSRSYLQPDGSMAVRFGYTDEAGQKAHRGLIDPDVTTVRFREADSGKNIATIVHFACHVTSLGRRGELISPDFPGYALAEVEDELGGMGFFLQGAGGNVGPGKDSDASLERSRLLGNRVAQAALRAARRAVSCPATPLRLLAWDQVVELDPDMPSEEEARAAFEACAREGGTSNKLWGHAARLEVVSQAEAVTRCDLFALQLGDWCLAGLPGESFVEAQLAIRAASPMPFTTVGAYYDTTLWYIPTWKSLREGGYESRHGWNYAAAGSSELLTRSVIDHIRNLKPATDPLRPVKWERS